MNRFFCIIKLKMIFVVCYTVATMAKQNQLHGFVKRPNVCLPELTGLVSDIFHEYMILYSGFNGALAHARECEHNLITGNMDIIKGFYLNLSDCVSSVKWYDENIETLIKYVKTSNLHHRDIILPIVVPFDLTNISNKSRKMINNILTHKRKTFLANNNLGFGTLVYAVAVSEEIKKIAAHYKLHLDEAMTVGDVLFRSLDMINGHVTTYCSYRNRFSPVMVEKFEYLNPEKYLPIAFRIIARLYSYVSLYEPDRVRAMHGEFKSALSLYIKRVKEHAAKKESANESVADAAAAEIASAELNSPCSDLNEAKHEVRSETRL